MAEDKKSKEEQNKAKQIKAKKEGFYHQNTVEVTLPNGRKARVNKFESAKLEKQMKAKAEKRANKAATVLQQASAPTP